MPSKTVYRLDGDQRDYTSWEHAYCAANFLTDSKERASVAACPSGHLSALMRLLPARSDWERVKPEVIAHLNGRGKREVPA